MSTAKKVFDDSKDLLESLSARWADESEYEDINDYRRAIENALPGVQVTKMNKRPFGFEFVTAEGTFRIACGARSMTMTRLAPPKAGGVEAQHAAAKQDQAAAEAALPEPEAEPNAEPEEFDYLVHCSADDGSFAEILFVSAPNSKTARKRGEAQARSMGLKPGDLVFNAERLPVDDYPLGPQFAH